MARTGRPSTYTPDIAADICAQLASGVPLTRICAADDAPGITTVYQWLAAHSDFAERYARAREDQADTLAAEIQQIADSANTWDRASVDKARLQIDARKWIAAKLKPRTYSERISQDVAVTGLGDVLREASALLRKAETGT